MAESGQPNSQAKTLLGKAQMKSNVHAPRKKLADPQGMQACWKRTHDLKCSSLGASRSIMLASLRKCLDSYYDAAH